ncbi:RNA-directed DNA polymerase, eukaryota, reverse transcriptase zinc-binding domain protein, partial [Tanacetum coccineum]
MEPSLEGYDIDLAEEEVNRYRLIWRPRKKRIVDDSLSHPPVYTNEVPNDDRYVTVERGGSCGSPFSDSVQQIPNQVSMVDGLDALIEMGIAMGYSIRIVDKGTWLRKLCNKHRVNFVAIQETKVSSIDIAIVRSLWGNMHFDYLHSEASGLSGGILVIWEPNLLGWKKTSVESLLRLFSRIEGEIVLMGDFNEVRDVLEWFGTVFHEHVARYFNQFIYDSALVDVPLGGFSFTWSNRLEQQVDYGPHPFRLFHSWMELEGFDKLVKDSWEMPVAGELNAMIIFKKKLQSLKNNIKHWNNLRRQTSKAHKYQLRCEVEDIQTRVEDGSTSIDDIQKRVHLIKQIREIEHVENLDLAQKAKVKWAIEGYKNSSYFHSSINRKRRQAAIRGVIKDGVWMAEPNDIKAEFKDHFQSQVVNDPRFTSNFRPISLIGCQYKITGKLLANRLVMVIDLIVSLGQSAFIKVRRILDGPMMLSEIIAHFKATRRKLMMFKVDFEKAYDSLSWEFLFEVMNKMGFTINWFTWVKATLASSRASMLLNRAPTEEFDIQRGLRKGDPLSPFLFVLAMEGFHVGISEACRANAFQGVSTGSSDIRISHLLYADDAILL